VVASPDSEKTVPTPSEVAKPWAVDTRRSLPARQTATDAVPHGPESAVRTPTLGRPAAPAALKFASPTDDYVLRHATTGES
jgi:hypothetical protein